MANTDEQTLLERIGGVDALHTLVGAFYFNVLNDPRVAPFFKDIDFLKVLDHQRRFLTQAFGGAREYSGRSLRAAHSHLVRDAGLQAEHFDAIADILRYTLNDLNFSDPVIEEVLAVVESVRADVLAG